DVFPDPAAPAEADEGAPGVGQELAPRRHRGYVRRTGGQGHQGGRRGADRGRDCRWRAGAAGALDDHGRARQGRAGQGRREGLNGGHPTRSLLIRALLRAFGASPTGTSVMMYISRWKALGILLTALVVCMLAVPNFFPEKMVQSWPKWAQRHVVLGLDLQGGSHLLLEVDTGAVRKEKLEQLRDDVRRVLRE